MKGIDLNALVRYKHSSFRYFYPGEHHVDRICEDDVLLLVFEGVLRFVEDGRSYEVGPGEYHIQRRNGCQQGPVSSDSPKYLYVHFHAAWEDEGELLPFRGTFIHQRLKPLMERLDMMSHGKYTLVEKSAVFLEILSILYRDNKVQTVSDRIAEYLAEHFTGPVYLEQLCDEFHFSKNHIINLFKQRYGMTPFEYVNLLRIRKAKHLLEATSSPIEQISVESGFRNYSHFYRLFLRESQMSPAQWRKQSRIQPTIK